MDNRKTTKRRMVADGIVVLLEVGFLIASWVWVFLSPDDIFIRASAYLATLIVLITLWGMTLGSEIRQLRIISEGLIEISQNIQSSLLGENAELRKRLQDAHQRLEFDELDRVRLEATYRNRVTDLEARNATLYSINLKLQAALKQQAPTPANEEWEP